jgi:ABC-type branched-subunit amino acid transport system ATPase component
MSTTSTGPARPANPATPPAASALDAEITVYRGKAAVVRGVGLTVAHGAAVGIVGRNGAGKTTLLHGICGLLPATGTLRLDGASLAGLPAHRRATRGLALVAQGRRLFADLSVKDNLRAATLSPVGAGPEIDVHELFPELAVLLRRRAGLLSGGQQQQVAIARALLRRPRVLLLDEPTEGLAPALVDEVTRALHALTGHGLALVIAEQRLDVIEQLCRQFLVLRAGAPVAFGAVDSPEVRQQALTF